MRLISINFRGLAPKSCSRNRTYMNFAVLHHKHPILNHCSCRFLSVIDLYTERGRQQRQHDNTFIKSDTLTHPHTRVNTHSSLCTPHQHWTQINTLIGGLIMHKGLCAYTHHRHTHHTHRWFSSLIRTMTKRLLALMNRAIERRERRRERSERADRPEKNLHTCYQSQKVNDLSWRSSTNWD